jgi:ubiquinone biosynthesis UbiH/UbiF/VisC/COQ6 family hydroxylase
MAEARFDVIVVGGGLVGAAAALAVGRTGAEVLLLDRRAPELVQGRLGFDLRTVALNPASAALLGGLGVDVTAMGEPFSHMFVWEEEGTRHIEFDAAEVGRHDLGWIVEVSPAVAALWRVAADEPRLRIETGHEVMHIESGQGTVAVDYGADRFEASLLLAADGGHSTVRRLLGVEPARFETGQAAIVSIVETQTPHRATAWQRFLHEGPIALLPLPSRDGRHFCSLVWSQSAGRAAARMQLDDAAFGREVSRATEERLGTIRDVDARVSFPLEQLLAHDFKAAPGVLLVGDAARVLHPLAGQGVNLGFEDVSGIAGAIAGVGRAAIGDDALWRGWARRRHTRGEVMVRAMDAFRRLYAVRDPTLQWLRNVGVDLVNRTPFLKAQLMKEALGLRS